MMILLTFSGCSLRYYRPDICIPLEGQVGEIVIREWSFLLGSGAEIYYRVGFIELELGQLPGGDDGFCPFEAGQYAVTVNGNKVTIQWNDHLPGGQLPQALWKTKTFEIPEFKDWWEYLF
jgi:hypothetical protein